MSKILIVDDDEKIRKTLWRNLSKKGYELDEAADGEMAIRKLTEFLPDLILLDVMMPNINGWEVCRRLKSNPKLNFIFIIMLTARTASDDELAGFEAGVDDYVAKPFDPKILLARISKGLRTVKERKSAMFDPLTGLYNRRIFGVRLAEELSRVKRYQHDLSLIMVDIDYFKKVNDTFGHLVGDMILKELAGILRDVSRGTDLPVRWGGEEFLLLLIETGREGALVIAERLREKVENHHFADVDKITISLGVNTTAGSDGSSLLAEADKALYQAKKNGRNQVVVAAQGQEKTIADPVNEAER